MWGHSYDSDTEQNKLKTFFLKFSLQYYPNSRTAYLSISKRQTKKYLSFLIQTGYCYRIYTDHQYNSSIYKGYALATQDDTIVLKTYLADFFPHVIQGGEYHALSHFLGDEEIHNR